MAEDRILSRSEGGGLLFDGCQISTFYVEINIYNRCIYEVPREGPKLKRQ